MLRKTRKAISLLLAIAMLGTMLFTGVSANTELTGLDLWTSEEYLIGSTDCTDGSSGQDVNFWSNRYFANYVSLEDGHGSVLRPTYHGSAAFAKELGDENGYQSGVLTVSFDKYQEASLQQEFSFYVYTADTAIENNNTQQRGDTQLIAQGGESGLGDSTHAQMGFGAWKSDLFLSTIKTENTVNADTGAAEWMSYDIVIDMVEDTVTVYKNGEVFLTQEWVLDAVYGFSVGWRNWALDSDTNEYTVKYYLDNFAVYWMQGEEKEEEIFVSEAAPYTQEKNLLGSSDGSDTTEQERTFWDNRYYPNYPTLTDGHGQVQQALYGGGFTFGKLVGDDTEKGYYGAGDGAITLAFDRKTDVVTADHWFNVWNEVPAYTGNANLRGSNRLVTGTGINSTMRIGLGQYNDANDIWRKNTFANNVVVSPNLDAGGNAVWKRYEYVIDLVYSTITIYVDGVKTLSAPVPAERLEKVYAVEIGGRNWDYNSGKIDYYDNFALYFTPASELPANEAGEYVLGKNRLDWTYGVDTGGAYADNAFWTGRSSQGYVGTGFPLYGTALMPNTHNGGQKYVKAVGDEYGYENGTGVFTFSFDKYEIQGAERQLAVRVMESVPATDLITSFLNNEFTEIYTQSGATTTAGGLVGATAIETGTGGWAHYDVVFDLISNEIKLFVDGVLTQTVSKEFDVIYGVGIRTRNVTNDNTNYYVDNCAVYWTPANVFLAKGVGVTDSDGNAVENTSAITTTTALNATARIINNTEESKNYMISYAVYNGDKMTDVEFVETSIEAGTTATPTIPFTVADTTDLKIKVFVWDGIDTMAPYANNAIVEAQ